MSRATCAFALVLPLLLAGIPPARTCPLWNKESVHFYLGERYDGTPFRPDYSWPPPVAWDGDPSRAASFPKPPERSGPEGGGYLVPPDLVADWQRVLRLEAAGRFATAAAMLETMLRRGRGNLNNDHFNAALDRLTLFREPGIEREPDMVRRYLAIRDGPCRRDELDQAQRELEELLEQPRRRSNLPPPTSWPRYVISRSGMARRYDCTAQ